MHSTYRHEIMKPTHPDYAVTRIGLSIGQIEGEKALSPVEYIKFSD